MDDLLDTYSRMKLLEMARSDYDVDGLIGRADKLAAWTTGQKASVTIKDFDLTKPVEGIHITRDEAGGFAITGNTLAGVNPSTLARSEFPLVDDAIAAAAEPVRKERKPRGPNKVKAAKAKRGRPAKAKTADTGDAHGDAPVPNGAGPHVDPQPEAEHSPMAA